MHIVAMVWVERGQIDFVSHKNHLHTAYGFQAGVSVVLSWSHLACTVGHVALGVEHARASEHGRAWEGIIPRVTLIPQ